MSVIIQIVLTLLILSATALCIYLIFYLKKILNQIDDMRKDIHQLVEKTIPVFEKLDTAADKANRIVSEVEGYWDDLESSINNLKQKVSNITSFKKTTTSENSVSDFIRNLRAISRGLVSFWDALKNR